MCRRRALFPEEADKVDLCHSSSVGRIVHSMNCVQCLEGIRHRGLSRDAILVGSVVPEEALNASSRGLNPVSPEKKTIAREFLVEARNASGHPRAKVKLTLTR